MSEYFYCVDCGKDVKAPHFCEAKSGNAAGGIGFNVDLIAAWKRVTGDDEKRAKEFGIPQEYIDSMKELWRKFDADEIGITEFEDQMHHIDNLISIWRRLNGKETNDRVVWS